MIIRKTRLACLTSFTCGALVLACSDDSSSPGTPSFDWDGGVDAGNTWDTNITTDFSFTIPGDTSAVTTDFTSAPGWADGGVNTDTDTDSTAFDGGSTEIDGGWWGNTGTDTDPSTDTDTDPSTDTDTDDSTTDTDNTSTDTAVDGGTTETDIPPIEGDAAVYNPDGGVVLRPEELAFNELYVSQLQVPNGFQVSVYATPGGKARMIAERDGALYVTRPEQGDVLRLEDTNDDGVADQQSVAISGYPMVHGIVFDENVVYLATAKELIRATVGGDGNFNAPQVLIDDLPDGGQHPLRTLGIGPDGELYLSIGSSCDACVETNPEHAAILRVASDGTSRTVFASGLRNTIGFGWHPVTNQFWGMDHGSDWRGNDIPPEELNLIEQGNNYGWPYCYGKALLDPIIGSPSGMTQAEYCATTTPSVLESQAHQAPIGMVFYDADQFPAAYRGDAFVAMRGSWNRSPATGYKVVRIVFDDAGQPQSVEDFVTGFLNEQGTATFGRPSGIAVDGTGALVFTDDTNGVLYRVTAAQ